MGAALETDVKQELVCITTPLQQASWRRHVALARPRPGTSKVLPHSSPRSARDLLFPLTASRVETRKETKKQNALCPDDTDSLEPGLQVETSVEDKR